jgi:hypothetical protein
VHKIAEVWFGCPVWVHVADTSPVEGHKRPNHYFTFVKRGNSRVWRSLSLPLPSADAESDSFYGFLAINSCHAASINVRKHVLR